MQKNTAKDKISTINKISLSNKAIINRRKSNVSIKTS